MIEEAVRTPLAAWESFYVIVGSSGAALTGLQFVVMALVAESPAKGTSREIDAFGTPIIVHFCAVLLIAAILSAPWQGLTNVSLILSAFGLIGIFYCIVVIRRARSTMGYVPVWEDWLWHVVLPMISYVTLVVSSLLLRNHAQPALFPIGGVSLLLLFVGIHNSWDTVTYIALYVKEQKAKSEAQSVKGEGNGQAPAANVSQGKPKARKGRR
jgi:hypothetical protein